MVLSRLRHAPQAGSAGGDELIGLEVELQEMMSGNFCLIVSLDFSNVVIVLFWQFTSSTTNLVKKTKRELTLGLFKSGFFYPGKHAV